MAKLIMTVLILKYSAHATSHGKRLDIGVYVTSESEYNYIRSTA